MKLTVKEVHERIEEQLLLSKKFHEEDTRDSDYAISDKYRREVNRLERLLRVMELTDDWEHYGAGLIIFKDKFVYALITGSWRVKGKEKWYRGTTPENMYNKYVKVDKYA